MCRHLALLLLVLLASCNGHSAHDRTYCERLTCYQGAVTRGSTEQKTLALVFTGDEFADGADTILAVLQSKDIPAAFFLTGHFYRNANFAAAIDRIRDNGHYLGAHSDQHLLYCPWERRDSLLVSKAQFIEDLEANYSEILRFGVEKKDAPFFLPPYEWYNDSISHWTRMLGLQLINYTPGTISHADYTTPDLPNYRGSDEILQSILDFEQTSEEGLNGFILLSHIGVAPERKDKFYFKLSELVDELVDRGYTFQRIDHLLQ